MIMMAMILSLVSSNKMSSGCYTMCQWGLLITWQERLILSTQRRHKSANQQERTTARPDFYCFLSEGFEISTLVGKGHRGCRLCGEYKKDKLKHKAKKSLDGFGGMCEFWWVYYIALSGAKWTDHIATRSQWEFERYKRKSKLGTKYWQECAMWIID